MHDCCKWFLAACNLVQAHEIDATNTTASFRQFHVDQIGADMKESICRVSDTPFDAQENAHVPTVSYEVTLSHSASLSCMQPISQTFSN